MKIPRSLIRILYPASLAGIALASLAPLVPQSPPGIEYLDKIEHGFSYSIAGALGAFFFRRSGLGRLGAPAVSIALGLAVGVAVEFLQPIVGRSCELADGLADLAGLLAGAVFFLAASRPRGRASEVLTPR